MNPTILVIEDDASMAELLRYNLEHEGFKVAYAADGEEGLMRAQEEPPDLVLLDWMLPMVSGIEVCRRLRRQPETRNTPIIMLTARGEEADRIRGLDTGADDYITKPFSPSELSGPGPCRFAAGAPRPRRRRSRIRRHPDGYREPQGHPRW